MTAITPAIGTFDSGSELCRLFDYFCATFWAHNYSMVVEVPVACIHILDSGILDTVYPDPIKHSCTRVPVVNLCERSKKFMGEADECIQVLVCFPKEG